MPAISSIPAWHPVPARSPAIHASRGEDTVAPMASPSTIVNLRSQGAAGALNWESASQDEVTALIAKNFAAGSPAGRFNGLGASLLHRFKVEGGGGDLSQSVQLAPAHPPATAYGAVQAAAVPALHGVGDDRISLSITTRNGAQVTLALDSRDDGLAVQMSSSGELSEVERSALASLAGAFQDAIDGMAKVPPKVRLEGLTQFDPALLASVDFRAVIKSKTDPDSTHTLDFHADGAQRKVSLSGPSGTAALSVDTRNLASVGSTEKQAKAMGSYLKQFDQAAARGHGDAGLMAMFKDAFVGMNSQVGAKASAGYAQAGKWDLAAEDHAALTGLADFSASLTQKAGSINPMRPAEQTGFAYQVSQSTSTSGRNQGERAISQQQKSELKASFHTPAVPGASLKLDHTLQSQNYSHHQINDAASSEVDIAYTDGRLVRATLNQAATQSARVMQYVMGELVSDTVIPGQHKLQRDLLKALEPYLSGDPGQTDTQRNEQRKQLLSTLSEQVLLQSYPDSLEGAVDPD